MINENIIILNSECTSRTEVLESLADILIDEYINSKSEFIESVMNREKEMSTSIGNGIAIPHGKSDAIIKPFVAYLSTKEEFDWDETGKPVHMIFLIGVPKNDEGVIHLKILSQLNRRLVRSEFIELLNNAKDSKDIYQSFKEIENAVLESEREEE